MVEYKKEENDIRSGQVVEFDLIELVKKLWINKYFILKWCVISTIAALVVGFSIPNEYTTTVTLAPELSGGSRALDRLNGLATVAGLNTAGAENSDALSPQLYPDVISSIDFTTELFNVAVENNDGYLKTNLYDYLLNHQRFPWWSAVVSLPSDAIEWIGSLFMKDKEEKGMSKGVDPFRLTHDEMKVVKALNNRIGVAVRLKTSVISLSVTMQDPLISASITDTVMRKLQKHITAYRTNKARNDLDFTQKLFNEAEQKYYGAQQKYADYVDKNQGIPFRSVQIQQERLHNEMNLAYSLFNQIAKQLQIAKAKVQEKTPVYTVVEAPTVPLKSSKPSKIIILIGFLFLACIASCSWILFGREIKRQVWQRKPNF